MTNILLPSGGGITGQLASAATGYIAIGTAGMPLSSAVANESQAQTTWRTAGSFSNMYCRVSVNAATSASTINYRAGGVSGNQAISITGSTTGEFSDATHTDSASSGDQIDYQFVNGGGGSISLTYCAEQFAPTTTSNTINRLTCTGAITDTSATTSYFNTIVGTLSKNTTEAPSQFTNGATATLQNLYIYISANTASVATVTSRIGGVNGNLSASIGSGVTGAIEDTTHTDSIIAGNLINTVFNSTVTTSLTLNSISIEYLNTSGITHYLCGNNPGQTNVSSGTTGFFCTAGNTLAPITNAQKIKSGIGFTASGLQTYIKGNTIAANSTINFQSGGVNGNQSVTIGSSTTGFFQDAVNTDTVGASAEINYACTAGTSGAHIIAPSLIGVLATYSSSKGIATWAAAFSLSALGSALARSKATQSASTSFSAAGNGLVRSKLTISPSASVSFKKGAQITVTGNATWSSSISFLAKGKSLAKGSVIYSPNTSLSLIGKSSAKSIVTYSPHSSLSPHGASLLSSLATWAPSASFSAKGKSTAASVITITPHSALSFGAKSATRGKATWSPTISLTAAGKATTISGKGIATFSPSANFSPIGISTAKSKGTWSASSVFSPKSIAYVFSSGAWNASSGLQFHQTSKAASKAIWNASSNLSSFTKGSVTFYASAAWMSSVIFNVGGKGQIIPYKYPTKHLIGDPFPQRLRVGVTYQF